MVILWIFLLSLTYALGELPTCDEDSSATYCYDGVEVIDFDGHFYPESEDELDKFCRFAKKSFDCQIEFIERCPATLLGAAGESVRQYGETYIKLCDEETSLRQKFLEKGPCLNKEFEKSESGCSEMVEEKDYCKRIDPVLICTEQEMSRACGGDGEGVYKELVKPKYAVMNLFCLER